MICKNTHEKSSKSHRYLDRNTLESFFRDRYVQNRKIFVASVPLGFAHSRRQFSSPFALTFSPFLTAFPIFSPSSLEISEGLKDGRQRFLPVRTSQEGVHKMSDKEQTLSSLEGKKIGREKKEFTEDRLRRRRKLEAPKMNYNSYHTTGKITLIPRIPSGNCASDTTSFF